MDCLVYVDPSPRGEWALATAALLARPGRAFTVLATAEDVVRNPRLLEAARERLGAAADVRCASAPGPAEQAVAAEAREHRYGLLVVPPAGRGAVQRMLKGSRVATVVRAVRAPVWIARRPPQRFASVLAAVSGGRTSAAVCGAAASLTRELGAPVTFLHVASEVALPYRSGAPGEADVLPEPQARAAVAEAGFAADRLVVREGLVVEEVLDEFERGAHDLLALGASDEAERGRWGREDLTERILLRCPASTLVVPPAGLDLG
jgi:nucleotide-binding universal stress UspA family protein